MGLYGKHVLPRIIDVACGMRTGDPLRQRVCAGLYGDVVEVGFGSGHNVPFYPEVVRSVTAVEPSDLAWRLAPDAKVARWQRRLEPLQKRMVGGCHLTREMVPLLEAAGFTLHEVDVFYEEGAPKVLGADTLGVAAVTTSTG